MTRTNKTLTAKNIRKHLHFSYDGLWIRWSFLRMDGFEFLQSLNDIWEGEAFAAMPKIWIKFKVFLFSHRILLDEKRAVWGIAYKKKRTRAAELKISSLKAKEENGK